MLNTLSGFLYIINQVVERINLSGYAQVKACRVDRWNEYVTARPIWRGTPLNLMLKAPPLMSHVTCKNWNCHSDQVRNVPVMPIHAEPGK